MFKKFKDRLTEVSEEVKKDPRFVNGIASVNQLVKKKLFETQSVVLDSVFSQIFLDFTGPANCSGNKKRQNRREQRVS